MQSVTSKVKPIPEGYHSLTPVVVVDGAPRLIDFLKQVFNAEEDEVYKGPDGRVIHAELRIGDSVLMISDSNPQFPALPAMSNQFYGDRTAGIKDVYGNQWWIATHVEDLSQEELEKRMKARESQ